MSFARQLFAASTQQASLLFRFRLGEPARTATLELHHGWVCAIDLRRLADGPLPSVAARPEDQLLQLLAIAAAPSETAPTPVVRHGECQPFHPADSLRRFYDAQAVRADRVEAHLAGRPLQLRTTPHASCLLPDERRLCAQLAARPHQLGELYRLQPILPERVHHLLGFLFWLDALDVPSERPALLAALALAEPISDEELRRAYRDRVRALHPDLNPEVPDDEALQALNQRWAAWEIEAALLSQTRPSSTRRSRG